MPSFARACGARQRDGVLWGAKGAQRLSLPTTHHLSMMPQSRASEGVCCVMGKICPAPFAPHNTPSIYDAAEPVREYVVGKMRFAHCPHNILIKKASSCGARQVDGRAAQWMIWCGQMYTAHLPTPHTLFGRRRKVQECYNVGMQKIERLVAIT